jgi:hypothetical protein
MNCMVAGADFNERKPLSFTLVRPPLFAPHDPDREKRSLADAGASLEL